MSEENKAREKAIEIVEKFYSETTDMPLVLVQSINIVDPNDVAFIQSKNCAIICVDEILNSSPSLPILSDNGSYGSDIELSTDWWRKVKSEIQNL